MRHSAKRIAVYNHKGGVGKTTLTVNMAAALANMNRKVLLVDSDPQSNLTSYLIPDEVVDDLLDKSDGPSGNTIWSALRPIVEAQGGLKDITVTETSINGLYLLAGDIRLSVFESELSEYWINCLGRKPRAFRGITALSDLVNKYAEEKEADYVFYDTGPNIGPLNRVILLDCDYFIIPGACDLFSVRALKTLGYSVTAWIKDWKTIRMVAPDDVALLPGMPRFLGYIPQGFRMYAGRIVKKQSEYHAKFERHLHSDVVAELRKIDLHLVVEGDGRSTKQKYRLGQVKDFATLIQHAQEHGLPLWQTEGGAPHLALEAEAVFSEIAANVDSRCMTESD